MAEGDAKPSGVSVNIKDFVIKASEKEKVAAITSAWTMAPPGFMDKPLNEYLPKEKTRKKKEGKKKKR